MNEIDDPLPPRHVLRAIQSPAPRRNARGVGQYDWNMLPIGQALWLKELQTYLDFPMLQNPARLPNIWSRSCSRSNK